ncbi:MAG: alanine racemase [Pseudomonadota bacterium]
MPRPLVATIHIDSMRHNLALAASQAAGAKVWAVVKANAYGHGLKSAIAAFAKADGLGLIEFDNAVALRESGWHKPILMLEGCFDAVDLETAAEHRLDIVVHCSEQIDMLEAVQRPSADGEMLGVFLKLNSGMNRLGFSPQALAGAYRRLRALPNVGKIALMTHFANADEADNAALPLARQLECFNGSIGVLGDFRGDTTLANSATDLLHPALAADWVRPGIMLYGGSPGGGSAGDFGLWPAMTLASQLIGTQDIQPGEAVGYGSRFVATRAMRIGVVACGYADGYPRHAPDGTPVLVAGVRTRIVGRVSMDMLTVDLSPVPGAGVGCPVTLWGHGLPIDEVAAMAGTIGYELMCALAPRVRVVHADLHANSVTAPVTAPITAFTHGKS